MKQKIEAQNSAKNQAEENNSKSPFKLYQIILPIVLGLVVVVLMFLHEFDLNSFQEIKFTWRTVGYIFLAFLLILFRDFWMSTRFRIMTNNELSWKQAYRVNYLREFACSIMPPTIGGGAFAILFLSKEGINAGRSMTITIINLFFDNLFYCVSCPLIFLLVPMNELFNNTSVVSSSITVIFWTVYPILFTWTTILFIGIFSRPDLIGRFLKYLFRLRFLKRWQSQVVVFADNLVAASKELKKQSFTLWLKALIATFLLWTSRFFLVNALFMGFTHVDNHLIIYGRQLLLWVVMVVSPTPGGSGLNEIAFKGIYNDLALSGGAILIIICIWRIITYYMYLLIGIIITPRWLKKSFTKNTKPVQS